MVLALVTLCLIIFAAEAFTLCKNAADYTPDKVSEAHCTGDEGMPVDREKCTKHGCNPDGDDGCECESKEKCEAYGGEWEERTCLEQAGWFSAGGMTSDSLNTDTCEVSDWDPNNWFSGATFKQMLTVVARQCCGAEGKSCYDGSNDACSCDASVDTSTCTDANAAGYEKQVCGDHSHAWTALECEKQYGGGRRLSVAKCYEAITKYKACMMEKCSETKFWKQRAGGVDSMITKMAAQMPSTTTAGPQAVADCAHGLSALIALVGAGAAHAL